MDCGLNSANKICPVKNTTIVGQLYIFCVVASYDGLTLIICSAITAMPMIKWAKLLGCVCVVHVCVCVVCACVCGGVGVCVWCMCVCVVRACGCACVDSAKFISPLLPAVQTSEFSHEWILPRYKQKPDKIKIE